LNSGFALGRHVDHTTHVWMALTSPSSLALTCVRDSVLTKVLSALRQGEPHSLLTGAVTCLILGSLLEQNVL
jgi:hypothetical protein